MAEETQIFKLDLDIKEFTENALSAKGSITEIGKAENLSELARSLIETTAGLAAIGVAAFALKTTFDLVFEGEQIKKTNNLFNEMAKSIGLAGEALKEDLVKATHGLADDTEILNAANKAIITMGESAKRLPEVMDLARKVTSAFGGDLIERFQQINYAIASGSTRMLRQNGIMIDAEKAVKEYARSLGVSSDMLTQQGRQQAILNAALEFGGERFKDIKGSQDSVITTTKQLVVSLNELKETFIVAFEKVAGPTVRNFLKGFSDMVREVKYYIDDQFGEGTAKMEGHIYKVRQQIKFLETDISDMEKNVGKERGWFEKALGIGGNLEAKISAAKAQLASLKKDLTESESKEAEHNKKLEDEKKEAALNDSKRASEALINAEKVKENKLRIEDEILKLQEQNAQRRIDMAVNETELERGRQDLMLIYAQEHEAKIAEIEEQWRTKKIVDHEQYLRLKEAIDEQYYDKLRTMEEKSSAEESRMDENRLRHAQTVWGGISAAAQKSAHDATKGMTNAAHLGMVAFDAFKKNGVTMFEQFGKAAVDHSMSASEIMKGFFLNSLADIAMAQGQVYLAQGLMGDPGAIAAGAALIALSGALRAMAGSAGGGGGGIGEYGGGAGGGFGAYAPERTSPEAAATAPQKSVQLVVQGNYFETEQTKTKLLDMIRSATDATDFKYVQIGKT